MDSRRTRRNSRFGLDELFRKFPGLSVRPSDSTDLVIAGEAEFQIEHPRWGTFLECFELELRVPDNFPSVVPLAFERAKRISNTFHKNLGGELCLGSPLRLQLILREHPTLLGFVENAIVPYLLNFVIWQKTGELPLGELKHGRRGLLDDYRSILNVADDELCVRLLAVLKVKKRVANKLACPCGSGRRIGRCHNRTLNRLRRAGPRSWFAKIYMQLNLQS